ncbi:hypothetical protein I350_04652 [Cryptococcus amylolentus CBS 6273]|uniref:SEC7 domain-containing protein n=1 Tax=Cryptococcus amylolentus CBS 6273 TaxID=1296118 RepID=A0A1E3JXK2_9TREE|nr:hypothetical protein I350_04652 [Cryptococcus amylolentus CBS 6273]
MSTSPKSPTKKYYYASRPSSRASRQENSPSDSAQVRSQAIAKLKRAASLPRQPNGRRPDARAARDEVEEPIESPVGGSRPVLEIATPAKQKGLGAENGDEQEMLSPSPVHTAFDHSAMYPSPIDPTNVQRSASAADYYSRPYDNSMSPIGNQTPDWHAMQLAQSYLPSLTPTSVSRFHPPRSTPSPLPTLGELRTLQRSNSQAARAHAMNKLTGGQNIAVSDEDITLHPSPSRNGLQRAGTLGAPRGLGILARRGNVEEPGVKMEQPSIDLEKPRPRLQRSFTVSSSNMGEERRSAVGRRMVERLAERREASKNEEAEVRRLWEERRAAAADLPDSGPIKDSQDSVAQSSPARLGKPLPAASNDMLAAPTIDNDRPISGGTFRSAQFEYEDHLRRSLSSRTARGALGTAPEPVPTIVMDSQGLEPEEEHLNTPTSVRPGDTAATEVYLDESPLLPPQPSFATPTRYTNHETVADEGTPTTSTPGDSTTTSGLDSMMFVMNGTPTGQHVNQAGVTEGNWPSDIGEGGSEWGTPSRDINQPQFINSPSLLSSPDPNSTSNGHLSPSFRDSSILESRMSWEELPATAQVAENPSHSRSGSVSARMKRSVQSALQKRSRSKSSVSSSPPVSPSQGSRGSGASGTPSQISIAQTQFPPRPVAQHHPSISSLAPSQADSSSSNLLIQHQLSADPSQVSLLPRANLNDPRIHMAKMSPFPGIDTLAGGESQGRLEAPPKLTQQYSDSVVPLTNSASEARDIYALPLEPRTASIDEKHGPVKRLSEDSVNKKNWLAKALASPRASISRKMSSEFRAQRENNTLGQGAMVIGSDVDPFASPPMGATPTLGQGATLSPPLPTRSRAASPTISMVPEANEEGRATRFAGMNGGVVQDAGEERALPEKSVEVLKKMDEVLALGPDDPARPEILDDPPRKFLMCAQILQVVNANTVKDRFLFLFNDLLVVAKPLITHGIHATLDMKFLVKHIVSLDKLSISGITDEPSSLVEPERHPVVNGFIKRFAEDPEEACRYLVERSQPKVDSATLASLIFKTPELDKAQVGKVLSGDAKLARAFVDRFHFNAVRIDDALRMLLLSIRLPTDPIACENLLYMFAEGYYEANRERVPYTREMTFDLVMAIMSFNDALYSTFGFALPNHAITRETFISAFRSKDPRGLVADQVLWDVYSSIRSMRLIQALASHEYRLERSVVMNPSQLPSKLTYGVWSERIYVSLPAADPMFRIKLLGEGLEFDPPVLDFAESSEESFRVRGTSLGSKSLLFDRVGSNAALYAGLGNTRHFVVERAFMRHTFQIAFVSHLGLKRKYCFSVNTPEARHKWGNLLERQIKQTRASKAESAEVSGHDGRVRQAIRRNAEAVSLQVLRDAVIPAEERKVSASGPTSSSIAPLASRPATAATVRPTTATNTVSPGEPSGRTRTASISAAYTQYALKEEYDLGPLVPTRGGPGEASDAMLRSQTGKELVLLCRQNSLMSGLLELLYAGTGNGGSEEELERSERSRGVRM